MRQITLDVETTGLSTKDGHRIIEIGCVEIIDRVITGKIFQTYCNPERLISEMAAKITGVKDEFLLNKPKFIEIIADFLDFIKGADELIIHNAAFDLEFINNEFKLLKHPIQDLASKFTIIDTLVLARSMHPGQRNNLDSLAKRYNLNFAREFHGALLDAKILANLILKMTAGQISLDFGRLIDNNQQDINFNYNKKYILENKEIKGKESEERQDSQDSTGIKNGIKNKDSIEIKDVISSKDITEIKDVINSKDGINSKDSIKIKNIEQYNNLKIVYANVEELVAHENYFNKLSN